jgi:hypothetical protein
VCPPCPRAQPVGLTRFKEKLTFRHLPSGQDARAKQKLRETGQRAAAFTDWSSSSTSVAYR